MNRKTKAWLTANCIMLLCSLSAAQNKVVWLVVKEPGSSYALSLGVDVNNASQMWVKGPQMPDYELADLKEGNQDFAWRMRNLNLAEVQNQSQGTWSLKFIFPDANESVYTFSVTGGIADSEFLPIPHILEPLDGDPNVIAEHCTFRWDPNDAAADANLLSLEAGLVDLGCLYREDFTGDAVDPNMTTWNPGWLELGQTYFKFGYVKFMFGRTGVLSHVSGPVISWYYAVPIPFWMSGDRVEFDVTKSMDLNDDDIINFEDFAFIASHWLETKQ